MVVSARSHTKPVSGPTSGDPEPRAVSGQLIDSSLAHSLAHDIRSPLTAIQLSVEALAASDDKARRESYASVVSRQAEFIAWCLEYLVALADVDLCAVEEMPPVNLREVVALALHEAESIRDARAPDACWASVDDTLFTRGIASVLGKAFRACFQVLLGCASEDVSMGISIHSGVDIGAPPGTARVRMVLASANSVAAQRLDMLKLPWSCVSLLSAVRIVGQHGGMISESRGVGEIGIGVLLPRAPRGDP